MFSSSSNNPAGLLQPNRLAACSTFAALRGDLVAADEVHTVAISGIYAELYFLSIGCEATDWYGLARADNG